MAKLVGLTVGNFKAFGPTQRIPIRPITLVFGPNSGGKSSIIHSIALLSSGLESRGLFGWDIHKTRLGGDTIDLGGFRNYVHRPNDGASVAIGAELSLSDALRSEPQSSDATKSAASITLEIGSIVTGGGRDRIGIRQIVLSDRNDAAIELTRLPPQSDPLVGTEGTISYVSEFNPDSALGQRLLREAEKRAMGRYTSYLAPLFWNNVTESSSLDDADLHQIDWTGYISQVLDESQDTYFFALSGYKFRYLEGFAETYGLGEQPSTHKPEVDFDQARRELAEHYEYLEKLKEKIGELDSNEENALSEINKEIDVWKEELNNLVEQQDRAEEAIESERMQWQYDLEKEASAFEAWVAARRAGEEVTPWIEQSEYLQDSHVRRSASQKFGELVEEELNRLYAALQWQFAPEQDLEIDYQLNAHHPPLSGPNVIYLGPLRIYPDRHLFESDSYKLGGARTGHDEWMSLFGDKADLEELNTLLGEGFLSSGYQVGIQEYTATHSTFKPAVLSAQSEDSAQDAKASRVRELKIYGEETGIELSNRDIGVGMSQVLPVLISLSTNQGKLIAVEQPELHLHPAMQARLGDIFIKNALETTARKKETRTSGKNRTIEPPVKPNTLVLETHSEHLILRILRRIRQTSEGTLPDHLPGVRPDDVSVLYVKPESEGARVIHIPINDQGEFEEPWPGGFFPERLNELLD